MLNLSLVLMQKEKKIHTTMFNKWKTSNVIKAWDILTICQLTVKKHTIMLKHEDEDKQKKYL